MGGVEDILLSNFDGMLLDDFGHSPLRSLLPMHIDFIDKALAEGGKCLVHCRMGVNRSASVVLAYLMARRGFSFDQAARHISKRRPRMAIHPSYESQLRVLPSGFAEPQGSPKNGGLHTTKDRLSARSRC